MKTFSIKLNGDAHAVVNKFQKAAAKHNFRFSGDESLGEFSGMGIHGRYDINGEDLTITIEKKPMLVGWSMIEGKVREFFA